MNGIILVIVAVLSLLAGAFLTRQRKVKNTERRFGSSKHYYAQTNIFNRPARQMFTEHEVQSAGVLAESNREDF